MATVTMTREAPKTTFVPFTASPGTGAAPPERPPGPLDYFQKLIEIIGRFQDDKTWNWNDDRSEKMFGWAGKVITDFSAATKNFTQMNFTKEFKEETQTRLNTLKNEILVGSFGPYPLVNPIMDVRIAVKEGGNISNLQDRLYSGRIYEKAFLRSYQRCESPFDRQPMYLKPHTFAKEMLAWLNSLPPEAFSAAESEEANASSSTEVIPTTDRPFSDEEYEYINILAQRELEIEKLQKIGRTAKDKIKVAERLEKKLREEIAQNVKRAKEEAAQQANSRGEQITKLEETYKADHEDNQKKIEGKKGELESEQKEHGKTKKAVENLKEDAKDLRKKIKEKADEIEGKTKPKKPRDGCW